MMTRLDMYDWLRRQLGIVPPIDDGTPDAQPGDLPPSRPTPSNPALQQAIENAVWRVNREAQLCQIDPTVMVSISVQTGEGPYSFPLLSLPRRGISRILAAWWHTSEGAIRRLRPLGSAEMDRLGRIWPATPASMPTRFWVEAGTVYIHPAPSAAGQLQLQVEHAVLPPQFDQDTFSWLPEELQTSVLYLALMDLAKTLVGDMEMQARIRVFEPDAMEALAALKSWAARQVGRYQPHLTFRSYRTGRVHR